MKVNQTPVHTLGYLLYLVVNHAKLFSPRLPAYTLLILFYIDCPISRFKILIRKLSWTSLDTGKNVPIHQLQCGTCQAGDHTLYNHGRSFSSTCSLTLLVLVIFLILGLKLFK